MALFFTLLLEGLAFDKALEKLSSTQFVEKMRLLAGVMQIQLYGRDKTWADLNGLSAYSPHRKEVVG
jgi:hypothetical protein